MKKFNIALLFTSTVYLLILSGCLKDKNEIAKGVPGAVLVDRSTVIADANTNAQLTQVTPNQLLYNGSSDQLTNLVEGSIIVSGVAEHAPRGYLRRVTSIVRGGSGVVINTQPAKLEDAIKECSIDYKRKFTINDTGSHKNEDLSFTKSFSQVIYDADGNYSTTSDQLSIEGTYTLDPDLLVGMQIHHNKIEYLKLGMACTQAADLKLISNLFNSPTVKNDYEFMNYPLDPIVLPISIFGIPIVIVPKLIGTIGADAQLSAQVSAGISGSFTQQAYVEYTRGIGWKPVYSQTFSPLVTEHTLSGTADAKAYVNAKLEFTFYDLDDVNSSLAAEVYVEGKGTCSATPNGFNDCNWGIDAGITADANVHAEVFGWTLLDYTANIFDYNKVLYQIGNNDSRTHFDLLNGRVDYGLNDCTLSTTGDSGSHANISFDINQSVFNPNQYFEIRNTYVAEDGTVGSIYYNSNASYISVINGGNTIQMDYCAHYGNSHYIDVTFSLFNDSYVSNPVTKRIFRPAGSYKQGDSKPVLLKPAQ